MQHYNQIGAMAQIHEKLQTYYQENCGEKDEDVWYSAPAANVRMFRRNNKLVALQYWLRKYDIISVAN